MGEIVHKTLLPAQESLSLGSELFESVHGLRASDREPAEAAYEGDDKPGLVRVVERLHALEQLVADRHHGQRDAEADRVARRDRARGPHGIDECGGGEQTVDRRRLPTGQRDQGDEVRHHQRRADEPDGSSL